LAVHCDAALCSSSVEGVGSTGFFLWWDKIGGEAGTQLGPYRIETVIGEGGVGVVYRALDTKLNRPVAVKFLFARANN
jgi:serine/threonine protein kinase